MISRICVAISLLVTTILSSQESLSKLQAPTSPAISILGMQPKKILAPKSFQELETALFSNFVNDDGSTAIPNNFGLEYMPYWSKNHSLSLEDYLYPDNTLDELIRNSSLSLASTQDFILGDSTSTNSLAFGYRTTLYFPNKSDKKMILQYGKDLKSNQNVNTAIVSIAQEAIIDTSVKTVEIFLAKIRVPLTDAIYKLKTNLKSKDVEQITRKVWSEIDSISHLFYTDKDLFLNEIISIVDNNIDARAQFIEYKSYIKNRYGLSIDFAYANSLNYPTNDFNYSIVPNQSVWLTPTYQFKDKLRFLKIIGVIRYEWYNLEYYKKYFPQTTIYENNTDYGLALSTAFENISLEFEVVGRKSNSEIPAGFDPDGNELFRKEKDSDLQYVLSINYNISDKIIFSYTFGNRFEPILESGNTLISLLSVNFGFGGPTTDNIKK